MYHFDTISLNSDFVYTGVMVDPATGYPLHPQEDVETSPSAGRASYADVYTPPDGQPAPVQPTQPPASQPPAPSPTNAVPPQTNPDPNQAANRFPGVPKPLPEETILDWYAPSRPFKKRTRQYYSTVAIIVILISMILFFAGQFLPIAVVISVAFLAYVLSVVPPGMVKHALTTFGIRVEGTLYYWDEMGRFWMTQKYGQPLLHIEVMRFPGRITLLLGDISEADMTEILSEVLLNQKPEPTFYDKAADWIQEKIPLEAEKPTETAQPVASPVNPAPQTPTS